jgi:hypothetical protein
MMEVLIVGSKDSIHQCNVLEFDEEVLDGQAQEFYPPMPRVRI